MTDELYINGQLCDMPDESVSLVFQSGIFSELDIIQSNHSYNISLPITARNVSAIQHANRPDAASNAPYRRLPAAFYRGGMPIFSKGFAYITEISDVINITLTWGNVDNFQQLFDADMSELADTLYGMGIGSIAWNEQSKIATWNNVSLTNAFPNLAFYGIDFGMGIDNIKYIHPSVMLAKVIEAIEKYNGFSIARKELLYKNNPIIPLVSNKGNEVSNHSEAVQMKYTNTRPSQTTIATEISNPRKIEHSSVDIHLDYFNSKAFVSSSKPISFRLDKYNNDNNIVESKIYKTGIDFISVDIEGYQTLHILPLQDDGGEVIVNVWSDWEDLLFPSIFPVAANLPDMSQGDFLNNLLTLNGLFAYTVDTNTIGLMSADELYANMDEGKSVDWSYKVLLNDLHRVEMPDSTVYQLDDWARKNILDYDNDDGEIKTDTHGEILIENDLLERKKETIIDFSATENVAITVKSTIDDTTGEIEIAKIPIYELSENAKEGDEPQYSDTTSRILIPHAGGKPENAGAGLEIGYFYGAFEPYQHFGGEAGIVKTKYEAIQRILKNVRIINVRAKLSIVDLATLDYRVPVFIQQFGQMYAIYSITTGENMICDCQLIQLPVKKDGYVRIYGRAANGISDASMSGVAVKINDEIVAYTDNNGQYSVDYHYDDYSNPITVNCYYEGNSVNNRTTINLNRGETEREVNFRIIIIKPIG